MEKIKLKFWIYPNNRLHFSLVSNKIPLADTVTPKQSPKKILLSSVVDALDLQSTFMKAAYSNGFWGEGLFNRNPKLESFLPNKKYSSVNSATSSFTSPICGGNFLIIKSTTSRTSKVKPFKKCSSFTSSTKGIGSTLLTWVKKDKCSSDEVLKMT